MGTRHIIAVQIDGEYKVAQYGQWDGYPNGQGVRVLRFLQDLMKEEAVAEFKKRVRATRFGTTEELNACFKKPEESNAFKTVTRDTSAGILSMILRGDAKVLRNDLSFVSDSLFCEWAYVIDFDTNTFEVFCGFNTKHKLGKKDRFYKFPTTESCSETYYPVWLRTSYDLDKLPTEEQFLKDNEDKE